MALIQAKRPIAVVSSLGEEVLLFRLMIAREQLGCLSEFNLELLSADEQIKFEEVLGQTMTVRLELPEGGKRYFNGYISRFCQVGRLGRYACYQATPTCTYPTARCCSGVTARGF